MTGKTSIEWATAVWNPTTGCTRVSAGCDNCYAFALHDKRYKSNLDAAQAHKAAERSDGIMRGHTIIWTARQTGAALPYPKQYDLPFSRVQLLPDRLDDPLRHRRPERYFVDSMADLFHDDVPDEYIARVFDTMRLAHQHTFLVLTKRPERMRELVDDMGDIGGAYDFVEDDGVWPLPNVWLGTSVEDQAAADERIPHLLATPAAVRFLSCEPLLGPVNLAPLLRPFCSPDSNGDRLHRPLDLSRTLTDLAAAGTYPASDGRSGVELNGIGWVIVGGESGPRARPMDLAWARSLVAQSKAAGLAVFVKQLGADPYYYAGEFGGLHDLTLRDRKGGDMAEWPEDLRVREFPR